MRKLYLMLAVLFMGITSAVRAQNVTDWDGANKPINVTAGQRQTFSYVATGSGTLYIMGQDLNGMAGSGLPVAIEGGVYANGAFVQDRAFEVAEDYDNGLGVFAQIEVNKGETIRFSLTGGTGTASTSFVLSSKLFAAGYGGRTPAEPVMLVQDSYVDLPSYPVGNEDAYGLYYSTFCKFTAPSSGVANMECAGENLLYYVEADKYGTDPLKYAVQDANDEKHEFAVQGGVEYLVIVPNSRPNTIKFEMTATRVGQHPAYPVVLKQFPGTQSLVKGNNWFLMDVSDLGNKDFMEIAVTAGWRGTVLYYDNINNTNPWLGSDWVEGEAATFKKDLDPNRTDNYETLLINVVLNDQERVQDGVSFSLREPQAGESASKAVPVALGDTPFGGEVRNYWFCYTAEQDIELTLGSDLGYLKHLSYSITEGNKQLPTGVYRMNEGQTIYLCYSVSSTAQGKLTLSSREVKPGDYCDYPIDFDLGADIEIADRGDLVSNYRRFVADKSGFAVLKTTCPEWVEGSWSVCVRNTCGGKALAISSEEYDDESTGNVGICYRVPITAGLTYNVEITSYSMAADKALVETYFEEATEGESCDTAMPLAGVNSMQPLTDTPELDVWFTYTAQEAGFYILRGKLGKGSNLRYKVAECSVNEVNTSIDNSMPNAYMAGYKIAKIYLEAGQPLFMHVTMGSDLGEVEGTDRYLSLTYAPARPGEHFADAIAATEGTTYTLPAGDDAFDTWYCYTIPAGQDTEIFLSAQVRNYSNLWFYADQDTKLSSYKGDYTQANLTGDDNAIVGKAYTLAKQEEPRVLYIQAPVSTLAEPVTWVIRNAATGVAAATAAQDGIITPNPCHGDFSISVAQVAQGARYSVYSASGLCVKAAPLTGTVTPVSLRAAAGLYTVVIENGQGRKAIKLVVNK